MKSILVIDDDAAVGHALRRALERFGHTVTVTTSGPDGIAALRRQPFDVVLTTIDNGHGMSTATMERIFEPFFTTREVGAGTGLGLAVAHGIAEAFDATILVESVLGVGSTFRVYIPVAPESAPQPAAAIPS